MPVYALNFEQYFIKANWSIYTIF